MKERVKVHVHILKVRLSDPTAVIQLFNALQLTNAHEHERCNHKLCRKEHVFMYLSMHRNDSIDISPCIKS